MKMRKKTVFVLNVFLEYPRQSTNQDKKDKFSKISRSKINLYKNISHYIEKELDDIIKIPSVSAPNYKTPGMNLIINKQGQNYIKDIKAEMT